MREKKKGRGVRGGYREGKKKKKRNVPQSHIHSLSSSRPSEKRRKGDQGESEMGKA